MRKYHHGWNIVAYGALLQVFSVGVFFYGFGVLLVPWSDSIGVPRGDLTIIPIAMQLTIGVLSPFSGRLIDKASPRLLVLVGIVAMIGALLLLASAESLLILVLAYIALVPLGQMLSGALMAQSLAAKWFSTHRGLALAITAAGGGIGGLVVPPLMQILIDAEGWRLALLYLAAILAVILLPGVMIVRSPPSTANQPMPANALAAQETEGEFTFREILLDPAFVLITVATGFALAIQLALSYNLPAMGSDVGGGTTASALLLSVLAGTSLCSKPAWGLVMDHFQSRYVFLAMVFCYLMSLMLTVLGLETLQFIFLIVGSSLCGLAAGAVQALMGVVLARRFGDHNFGKALGLGYTVINISAVGPVVASASYAMSGSYVIGLTCLGIALAAIATLVMMRSELAA